MGDWKDIAAWVMFTALLAGAMYFVILGFITLVCGG